ncbi:MAG: Single-stranded-DNA-specific exonuclease RecJ [Firmicutes bacterium ADurb.Bin193]|nr:MAG: Single-stranded-DNA-specific exonuclease RecJ [Firmicutes bacterium ADurb.Bin193]
MIHQKKWIYKEHNENKVKAICQEYGVLRLAAAVMQNRPDILCEVKTASPEKALYDPFMLKDSDKAVRRINSAIENKEHITIYGDYDADGVTSIVILYMYLKERGANVDYYIPDRVDEGYGINKGALESIRQNGTSLIITVDTGVTAVSEVEYAKKLGMDIIITDHHECKSSVPSCCAVIDPKREDCSYPFTELAGVGVVFKLIAAISGGNDIKELIKKYMAFVCLGTVADVVPLTDENRAFVTLGLERFSSSGNAGIDALLESARLADRKITAGSIGFIVAPRINAAGRLGRAHKSVELFLCNDKERAVTIAGELSEENKRRQTMEQKILDEAVSIIEQNRLHDQKVIVVSKDGWHHGVIGIVSSKITERYYRPSILISTDGDEGKGSGRSISGFNLFEALTYTSDCLAQFGGHSLAAGLSINPGRIGEFRSKINEYADSKLSGECLIPPVYIDAELKGGDINIDSVAGLSVLEPYGMGNPTPVFACTRARISRIGVMSEGRHIKILVNKDGHLLEAIGFNFGYLSDELKMGDCVDIAGTLDINHYNDRDKVQMYIKDVKKSCHK